MSFPFFFASGVSMTLYNLMHKVTESFQINTTQDHHSIKATCSDSQLSMERESEREREREKHTVLL